MVLGRERSWGVGAGTVSPLQYVHNRQIEYE